MTTTRGVLSHEESKIQENLLGLSEMADEAIERAMRCLNQQDVALAEEIVASDLKLNERQRRIEEECLATIARQQPVAADLRRIIAGLHIALELERIADHAADIAKIVMKMGDESSPIVLDHLLGRMAEQCRSMLHRVMEAYNKGDSEGAQAVAAEDETVDQLNEQIATRILSYLREHAGPSTRFATLLLWAAHNLERIGDRVTNIAEQVVFMATGHSVDLNRQ
jgi:phosphate transport system protein